MATSGDNSGWSVKLSQTYGTNKKCSAQVEYKLTENLDTVASQIIEYVKAGSSSTLQGVYRYDGTSKYDSHVARIKLSEESTPSAAQFGLSVVSFSIISLSLLLF